MKYQNLCLLAAFSCCGWTALAAEKPAVTPEDITVQADHMYYSDATGELQADGNVDIRQGLSWLQMDALTGNYKTHNYQVPGKLHWQNPEKEADADLWQTNYQGTTATASFAKAEGYFNKLYIRGEDGQYHQKNGHGHLGHGMITTRSAVAKVPDYRMEASDIDIYPGDKLVAHNAEFYIKNFRILRLKTYKTSLRPGSGGGLMSFIPQPRYNHRNGFGLRARWKYPIGDHAEAFINYDWYTKTGFKPDVGVRYFVPWGEFSLRYRKEESRLNDESIWVEKRPELAFHSRPLYLGQSPFYAKASLSYGKWYEGRVRGSHMGWHVQLARDPWRWGKGTQLTPSIGYWEDHYGYGHQQRSNFYYALRLDRQAGKRWNWWAGAEINRIHGESPYEFDQFDIERKGYVGFKFQVDRLNGLGAEYTWDLQDGKLVYEDYTWYRDLHSFTAAITYRAKENQWRVTVRAKDF